MRLRKNFRSVSTNHIENDEGTMVSEAYTFKYIEHRLSYKKPISNVKAILSDFLRTFLVTGFHVVACLTEVEWDIIQAHRKIKK